MRLAAVFALVGFSLVVVQSALAEDHGQAGADSRYFDSGTIELLDFVQHDFITSSTFGPDGRLYVSTLHGNERASTIAALTLDESGTQIEAGETIASGLHKVLGLAFDPDAPKGTPILYASHTELGQGSSSPEGGVSSFTGPNWLRNDLITGLPSGTSLHHTNGLAFDADGRLLISQGSLYDGVWGIESPLSAAILVADVHSQTFDGHVQYDPPGFPMDNEVDQVSGDVAVFASGFRNPYDLVVHSNGYVYATDNGDNFHLAQPCGEAVTFSRADEVNLIERDDYYGFSNLNRARFDPRQCIYHPPEEPSTSDYTAPIAVLPGGSSCNGITEYQNDPLDGTMNGDLLCVGLVGEVRRIVLSEDGREAESVEVIADLAGGIDITVGEAGIIYVTGGRDIQYLIPSTQPIVTGTPTQTLTPTPTLPATLTPTPTLTATLTPLMANGDVNCDGVVNAIDAALILQVDAGFKTSPPCLLNGDVNGDGRTTAVDATLVLQYVAGLLGTLPP